MISRKLSAPALRRLSDLARNLPSSAQTTQRQIASWAMQPPANYSPESDPKGPGRAALLALVGGAMAVGAGLHHALQRPRHLSAALQSHEDDTVMGALMEGSLLRFGFEDAARKLMISRAPHTRKHGAEFMLQHAPTEATLRSLQRLSEVEADSLVEHEKPWSYPYLAPGGIEDALYAGLARVLEHNPGLESTLLAATDRDALRLRPLLFLERCKEATAQAELTAMLKSPDAIVRRRAAYVLQRQTWPSNETPDAAPVWLSLVNDPDRAVRRQVCMGLTIAAWGSKPPAWVRPACHQLVGDADVLVNRFATAALQGPESLSA